MSTSNWWMFHGDPAHTGLVTGSGITSKNVARLKLLHDVPIPGPVLSVPAIVDAFVARAAEARADQVMAISATVAATA